MTTNIPVQTDYDIVIVGGGISGCLLAYAILHFSPALRVVLIDDNPEKLETGSHPGFDARSLALSAGSCDLLDKLGLWGALRDKAQPIDDIDISDRGHFGALALPKKEKKPFGHVIELQDIGAVIEQQLAKYPQLTRLYNTTISVIEKYQDNVRWQLNNGQWHSAKLCVGADGAQSRTRDLLGISAQTSDYGCSALIANIRSSKPHLNKAYERFTKYGPIALLPLTDNRYSLVWSENNLDANRLKNLDEQAFLSELQGAFGFRAGIFETAGQRDLYPLHLIKTAKPITHRGVCIGNAAHCLHPVMGQGFNLGFRDLYVLAELVGRERNSRLIGSYQMLNQYWSARKGDHNKTIAMTDSIVRIFSNNCGSFIAARNMALQAMSSFPSLTQPIVKQAIGQFNLNGIKNDSIL